MTREVMRRTASDNAYLHKDFHSALNVGIAYVHEHYGAEAVREYLRHFAAAYYAPLSDAIRACGLAALQEHLATIYAIEGSSVRLNLDNDSLLVEVEACPAVTHIRAQGHPLAALFFETSRTVYETICQGTPYMLEWRAYDPETGRASLRFVRREDAS
jgi:hypothetical protein